MLDLCKMPQYLTKIIQVDMRYLDKVRGAKILHFAMLHLATFGNLWEPLVMFRGCGHVFGTILNSSDFYINLRKCGCQNHTF